MAMLFTTGQLRSAFSLSKQQWRSYRECLPPLAKDHAHAPCFSAADLLSTSVVNCLNREMSIPLSLFTPIAEKLFSICSTCPWPQLERSCLFLDLLSLRVELVDSERRSTTATVALFVQLAPLVAELRGHLLADEPDPQRDLAFPPMIAGVRR